MTDKQLESLEEYKKILIESNVDSVVYANCISDFIRFCEMCNGMN